MHVSPPTLETPFVVHDQRNLRRRNANELGLRRDLAAGHARAHRDVARLAQFEETSASQLSARCLSLARSPMSIPVAPATWSIGVLMRSSGECTFA